MKKFKYNLVWSDYIWWNNLEKGPEVLCVSRKPNSKPDTFSLSAPGMRVNTDRKMTEGGTESNDIVYYNKMPVLLRGKYLLEMKAEILAPLMSMAKLWLTLPLAEFYPSPWNVDSRGSRKLLSLTFLFLFRIRLWSDVECRIKISLFAPSGLPFPSSSVSLEAACPLWQAEPGSEFVEKQVRTTHTAHSGVCRWYSLAGVRTVS